MLTYHGFTCPIDGLERVVRDVEARMGEALELFVPPRNRRILAGLPSITSEVAS